MTDKELTIWEHLDSVMRVLTSKEMGAWLYRRDKRVLVTELKKIKAEIELMDFDFGDYYDHTDTITEMFSKVIDNHIEELKGGTEEE